MQGTLVAFITKLCLKTFQYAKKPASLQVGRWFAHKHFYCLVFRTKGRHNNGKNIERLEKIKQKFYSKSL